VTFPSLPCPSPFPHLSPLHPSPIISLFSFLSPPFPFIFLPLSGPHIQLMVWVCQGALKSVSSLSRVRERTSAANAFVWQCEPRKRIWSLLVTAILGYFRLWKKWNVNYNRLLNMLSENDAIAIMTHSTSRDVLTPHVFPWPQLQSSYYWDNVFDFEVTTGNRYAIG